MKPNYQNSSYIANMNQNANYSRTSSLVLNLNANPYQSNKPQKKIQQLQQQQPMPPQNILNNINNINNQSNRIREVYADNFVEEIKIISNNLLQYPYVGMDTEFPGVIYPCPVASLDYYYQYTKVNVDKSLDIEKIVVHYSYDEIDPLLRSWLSQPVTLAGLNTDIPVYNETQIVFAYVTVTYKEGFSLSSTPTYIYTPYDENFIRVNIPRSRIIYQKSYGTKGWIVEQTETILDFLEAQLEEGPLNITGITSPVGDLSTYTIGDYKYKSDAQNILQFDAASKEAKPLTVSIIAGTPGKYDTYYAVVNLNANKWTKCSLKMTNFKTKDMIPLREWGNIKKLSFKNINNTIINNIIWV